MIILLPTQCIFICNPPNGMLVIKTKRGRGGEVGVGVAVGGRGTDVYMWNAKKENHISLPIFVMIVSAQGKIMEPFFLNKIRSKHSR